MASTIFIRLSKQAYKRDYGNFVYFYNNLNASDMVFSDAYVFTEKISRQPIEKSKVLDYIISAYDCPQSTEIVNDFNNFLNILVAGGYVVEGESLEELDRRESHFFYDMDNPKTERNMTVITDSQEEVLPRKILGDYFTQHPTLFTLQLDITEACTEHCIHCYVPEFKPVFLPFDKIKEVLDDFAEMGGLHVTLSGGECLLHPDFERIVRYIHQKDCICKILSNLTLCDDEKVALFKELECSVQVSLYSMNPTIHDSITRIHGSHNKTKRAIEKLYQANVPVKISCPTMQENFDQYLDVMKYAESMHMFAQTDCILMAKSDGDQSNLAHRLTLEQTRHVMEDMVMGCIPTMEKFFHPSHKEEMPAPEEWADDKICGAGIDSICLEADGSYCACSGFQGFSLGNCYKQSLRDVWENSPRLKYLRQLRGKDFPKCIHCKNRNYCSVCLVRNFNETGDMLKIIDHFCQVADINRQVVEEYHRDLERKHGK
ncbi:MAG: radical SAM protein [Victivallales bacterium]|nr:radical SAM protein [Victivallales bacterium]